MAASIASCPNNAGRSCRSSCSAFLFSLSPPVSIKTSTSVFATCGIACSGPAASKVSRTSSARSSSWRSAQARIISDARIADAWLDIQVDSIRRNASSCSPRVRRWAASRSVLSALGSRLSALNIVCIGDGAQRSPTTLDMPASRTAGHGPLALAGAASSLAPGPSPRGCAAGHWPIAARRPGSVSANTALVCCDCFIGRLPRWEDPLAQVTFAPTVAGRRSAGCYRTKPLREKYVNIHKIQMNFLLFLRIRNDFGGQPVRPAPSSAPPPNPCSSGEYRGT